MDTHKLTADALALLRALIATPSVSRSEEAAADTMAQYMDSYGLEYRREANNLWVVAPHYDSARPTLLLNAHIDTVKPVDNLDAQPLQPHARGRHALRPGQQRLRGRTGIAATGIPRHGRPAKGLQPNILSLGRGGSVGG